jgi:hypothetical protein
MTIIHYLLLVLLAAMATGHGAFVYRYMRYSPWRATWQGVTLMAQTLTLALLAVFYIFDTVVQGDWPGRQFLILMFMFALVGEAWAAFAGLVHVQRSSTPVTPRQGTGYVHPENIDKEQP